MNLKNLIQVYAGKNHPFYEAVEKVKITAPNATDYLNNIIDSFIRTVENDLITNVSYERRIKIEVVNDYLLQAENLLELQEFHPATAAVLIGASLEEFLRNWVKEESTHKDDVALDQRIVARKDAIDHKLAHPRPRENDFDDHRAAQQKAKTQGRHSDDRN